MKKLKLEKFKKINGTFYYYTNQNCNLTNIVYNFIYEKKKVENLRETYNRINCLENIEKEEDFSIIYFREYANWEYSRSKIEGSHSNKLVVFKRINKEELNETNCNDIIFTLNPLNKERIFYKKTDIEFLIKKDFLSLAKRILQLNVK